MIRLSTAQSYDSGLERLQQRQRELTDAQERLTSGKRVERASDDPAAAARAERALAAMSRHDASQRALDASRHVMSLAETTLGDAGELLQQVREALLSAGNGSYGDGERAVVAERQHGLRQQLLAAANRGDGAGGYLFGAQGSAEPPFVDTPGGVVFRGSSGQNSAALEESLALSVDGSREWLAAPTGNGLFETRSASPAPDSAGSWIDAGRVTDPALFFASTSPPLVADPDNLVYGISFATGAGGTTYTVVKDGAATGLTNVPYVDGQAIEIDGMAFSVRGTPAASDAFELRLSRNEQSLFATLDQAVAELRTGNRSGAAISQTVQRAITAVDSSMDGLQSLRARVGEQLNRADMVEGRIREQKVTAQEERSQAEDLDMVEAISLFQNRQSGYQAALQAYASVQKMSLFQYLNT